MPAGSSSTLSVLVDDSLPMCTDQDQTLPMELSPGTVTSTVAHMLQEEEKKITQVSSKSAANAANLDGATSAPSAEALLHKKCRWWLFNIGKTCSVYSCRGNVHIYVVYVDVYLSYTPSKYAVLFACICVHMLSHFDFKD